MTDLTAALLEVTLEVCLRDLEERTGAPPLTRVLVVGMGRLGGAEQGYGSDADVVFVHDPVEGADEGEAQTQALEVVKELIRLLGLQRPRPQPRRRRRPATRGQERAPGALAGVVPPVLQPLVAGLGGPGPAAGRAGGR